MEKQVRIGKPYKFINSYELVDHAISGYMATRDDYYVSIDMDDFRITAWYNRDDDIYSIHRFENTAYEKIYNKLTLTQRWELVNTILNKIAGI